MSMQTSSFNLVETTSVLQKRWKTILLFVIASALIATVTVFVVPKYFRSSATVVSANTALADKARIFNDNIKDLYSYFGSGDDLDRLQGIAKRETTFLQLVDEFSLIDYYKLKGDSLPVLRKEASLRLEKDILFKKTEEGQLQIIAWTKDKNLSANIVNRIVSIVQETATQIWQKNYSHQITNLDSAIAVMQQQYIHIADSVKAGSVQPFAELNLQQLRNRIESFGKIADEYKLAVQSLPPVLYVMETASPAAYAQRPDKKAVVIAATILALVFGCIVVLVNDRKKLA